MHYVNNINLGFNKINDNIVTISDDNITSFDDNITSYNSDKIYDLRIDDKIYLYLATYPGEKTIDQYIWSLAKKKNKLIEEFELVLKETAIDCDLFYNRNSYKTDETKLVCK